MAIGAVGGLAFGIGMGPKRNLSSTIGAACVGAFLASVIAHLIGGSLSSDEGATQTVARSSLVRLIGMALVTVLVALGAARGAIGHARSAARPATDH